jgi:hypothetical protein
MRKTTGFITGSLPLLLLLHSACVDAGIFLKTKDPVIIQGIYHSIHLSTILI